MVLKYQHNPNISSRTHTTTLSRLHKYALHTIINLHRLPAITYPSIGVSKSVNVMPIEMYRDFICRLEVGGVNSRMPTVCPVKIQ